MAGIKPLIFHLSYTMCSLYFVSCSRLDVQKVILESTDIENQVYGTSVPKIASESESNLDVSSDVTRNNTLAGGPVSIDCLRCLCLKLSNCIPIGCRMTQGSLGCGYFRLTNAFWIDCGKPGKDLPTCSNILSCASLCVQKYMQKYSKKFQCFQNCEGFTREIAGGPNGCNNPRTVAFWDRLQKIPGCKGVQ